MLPKIAVQKNHQSTRTRLIAQYLKETDYDFIFLQEAFTKYSYRHLVQEISEVYPFNTGSPFRRPLLPVNSGLVIFSKYPLKDTVIYPYYGMREADRFSSKGALVSIATLEDGTEVQLCNTHLQAQKHRGLIRARQLRKIQSMVLEQFKQKDKPLILAGDFNIGKYHDQEFEGMMAILNQFDVRTMEAQGELRYTTDYETNDMKQRYSEPDSLNDFIDYIFAFSSDQSPLKFNHLKVINIKGSYDLFSQPDWQEKTYSLSDHHAVEAIINI